MGERPTPKGIDGVSGFLGFRWEADDRLRITVEPKHINAAGLLSGAVSFAMIDYVMGSALWSQTTEDERIATLSLSINYVQTATAGDVIATATVDRRNDRIAVLSGEVRSDDGRLLATAIGSYSIFPRRRRSEQPAGPNVP